MKEKEEITSIRARIDRHSCWHPREDREYEASSMEEICVMLAEDIEKEIKYAINSDNSQGLNPLAMRFSECSGRAKHTKWQNVNTRWEMDVEVLITPRPAKPKPPKSEPKRKAVRSE